MLYDSLIIGGGVIGASVARYLSRFDAKILVIEKNNDVGDETSSKNSAIVHSGYDPKEGTLKAKFNVLGNRMMPQVCEELDVPFEKIGSLTVAFSDEEIETCKMLLERAKKNEVNAVLLTKEELFKIEPNVSREAYGAIFCEDAGIVSPFNLTVNLMENAIDNGAELLLNQKVTKITKKADFYEVFTEKGDKFEAKTVINCAGLYSENITALLEEPTYHIIPRKGQYYVLDHFLDGWVKHTLFMCPTKVGKGVLVSPTTSGNYILGPSNEDSLKEDNSTSPDILSEVKAAALKLVPNIPFNENIRQFAGVRANCSIGDFVIEESKLNPGFFNVAGIQSPGLASSPAIGDYVSLLVKEKLNLATKKDWNPRIRPHYSLAKLGKDKYNELIKKNPTYGRLICRCEKVSEGQIVDAIKRNCGATTIKGIKKRVRPGFGKCQGTFCEEFVLNILARELKLPLSEIKYSTDSNNVLLDTRKGK